MATGILFWFFSFPMGFLHQLRRRSFNSSRQPQYPITVVVGTWTTIHNISSSTKAELWAWEPLSSSFRPGHQRPQLLPGGVALVQMWTVGWASLALGISPILVPASHSISKCGFSYRIVSIHRRISLDRQIFDRRRHCGLLPTQCVEPLPPGPPTLPFSIFFAQPFSS